MSAGPAEDLYERRRSDIAFALADAGGLDCSVRRDACPLILGPRHAAGHFGRPHSGSIMAASIGCRRILALTDVGGLYCSVRRDVGWVHAARASRFECSRSCWGRLIRLRSAVCEREGVRCHGRRRAPLACHDALPSRQRERRKVHRAVGSLVAGGSDARHRRCIPRLHRRGSTLPSTIRASSTSPRGRSSAT